jgi:hypothetical protein
MPKTIRIAKTAIDDAISSFGKLPTKTPSDYLLKEAIQQVLPAINDLIKRGYNLDEISTLLTQKNIPISSSTLKQYLRDFNQTKAKSSKAKVSSSGTSSSSKSQVAVSSNSTGSASSQPVPTALSTENPIPDRDSTAEQVASTKKPYKSPPKPGAEQFK